MPVLLQEKTNTPNELNCDFDPRPRKGWKRQSFYEMEGQRFESRQSKDWQVPPGGARGRVGGTEGGEENGFGALLDRVGRSGTGKPHHIVWRAKHRDMMFGRARNSWRRLGGCSPPSQLCGKPLSNFRISTHRLHECPKRLKDLQCAGQPVVPLWIRGQDDGSDTTNELCRLQTKGEAMAGILIQEERLGGIHSNCKVAPLEKVAQRKSAWEAHTGLRNWTCRDTILGPSLLALGTPHPLLICVTIQH